MLYQVEMDLMDGTHVLQEQNPIDCYFVAVAIELNQTRGIISQIDVARDFPYENDSRII